MTPLTACHHPAQRRTAAQERAQQVGVHDGMEVGHRLLEEGRLSLDGRVVDEQVAVEAIGLEAGEGILDGRLAGDVHAPGPGRTAPRASAVACRRSRRRCRR